MSEKPLWSGRFQEGMSPATLDFTSSLEVDLRLAWFDGVGSLAHVRMLGRQGIVPKGDADLIAKGLLSILADLEEGNLEFDANLEDVHTNIEGMLTARIGDAGGRLHTARSRNDQVATDFRMYLRACLLDIAGMLLRLQDALLEQASRNMDVVLPGFTHTQHAQPVTLAHHLLAHAHRFHRDVDRFLDAYRRINLCPLGAAALAGTTYPIDREMTARSLGFDAPCANSMDAVSDRDFAAEFAFCCSLSMVHLSSLAEEIVLWSSPEFGFVEVDEKFATGSSIMPQKKNPDVAELVRGRSALALGDLASMLALLRSLPLTYNRDLQEDKTIVLRAADNLASCLDIAGRMVATLTFDRERMLHATEQGHLNATELADYLARKGVPFRQAHEVTGRMVRMAIKENKRLDQLTLEQMRSLSDGIEADVYQALSLQSCIQRRDSLGGTSPRMVGLQMKGLRSSMKDQEAAVSARRAHLRKTFDELLSG
ncbi:MAG: argininosuccinate lyase [Methanomassiliicoccales archaeon]|nr:argininosuccinate lyase [Methanomassiliicoccales archaeon]